MKVLCIGSATKDIFFPTNGGIVIDTPEDILSQKKIEFELGAKYQIERRHETLGGCVVNVASGLVKLGENADCYAGIGEDECGEWIKKNIAKEGIGTDKILVVENTLSDLSAIVVDANSGERVIFSNHRACKKFSIEEDKLDGYEWIFVGDLSGEWREVLKIILKKIEGKSVKIAFNPRQQMIHDDMENVSSMIAKTEVLFMNKDEALETVTNMQGNFSREELNDESFLVKKIKELGVGIVVLTDGIRGAWGYDGEKVLHVDAILQKKVVDTTGAGDAFASAFLAAYIKEKSLDEALKWGILNSSHSITEYGGQKGLLTEKQIEEAILDVKIDKI
ncbi:MAG TPA: carbohydrate kinase family protein [Candidatus Moranbacteria bacterium]|nr:carbohydrate kinase family protein [Candidatus Moranbacteria bacterium]